MEDIYIQKIIIKEVRNIKDFEIPLSDTEKKHLIITGKNGSGKTSVLRELKVFLNQIANKNFEHYENMKIALEQQKRHGESLLAEPKKNEAGIHNNNLAIRNSVNWFKTFGGTEIEFNKVSDIVNKFSEGEFIVAFFEAKRDTTFRTPTGINKIKTKPTYKIDDHAGEDFIQYIVNLKADKSFAKDDKDSATANKIDEWFKDFEESLTKLFETKNVHLEFDRKSYNFNIKEKGKEPYNLNQLSDGYSAILNIVTELIMRMEEHKTKSYDLQGIVLIDEIETHLHIDLQKKVLPFLTSFFPKIQFIVTTHSPFVLSSIEDAVICDLEKKIVTTDLSGYSYDTIIESYFESDKYSTVLKKYVDEYEALMTKNSLDEEQKEKLFELKQYLNEIPKFVSDELAVKLQQIKIKHLGKKEGEKK